MPTTAAVLDPGLAVAGLSADGAALGDGTARDALREAMRALSDAEAFVGSGHPAVRCQALAEVARALAGLHAYAAAESYLSRALHWATMMGGSDLLADLQCALAEVATNAADLAQLRGEPGMVVRHARERARDHAFEVARLARRASDSHWEVKLLLRASDVLDRCGDHDDAVQLQQRALELMGLHNAELPTVDDGPSQLVGGDGQHLTTPGRLM